MAGAARDQPNHRHHLARQLSASRGRRREVSFLLKNLDFLLKNLDFLLKNLDFLLKNLDFLLKNLDL